MTEITILYDIIRWEEKSIIQAAKKKGIVLKLQNARDIVFDINENYNVSLFNDASIVHKLSHQHLYTKFWIVRVSTLNDGIPTHQLKDYPVPVLIARFLEDFSF